MIVVDSSVAVAAITGGVAARRAIADERLVAPHLIDVEVVHALRGLLRGGKLTDEQARAALGLWGRLAVDRVPVAGSLPRLWELKDNLTAYDAAFVAVAETYGLPLLTADRRLAGAPGIHCEVRLLPG